jgi:hypothetical protein
MYKSGMKRTRTNKIGASARRPAPDRRSRKLADEAPSALSSDSDRAEGGNPFALFFEWSSEADERAYGNL